MSMDLRRRVLGVSDLGMHSSLYSHYCPNMTTTDIHPHAHFLARPCHFLLTPALTLSFAFVLFLDDPNPYREFAL